MFPQLPFNFYSPKKLVYADSNLLLQNIFNNTVISDIKPTNSYLVLDKIALSGGLSEVKFADSGLILSQIAATNNISEVKFASSELIVEPISLSTKVDVVADDASNVINAIEATGVTLNTTQKTAITNRIVNAKSDGVWSKWVAYYGFVGGTAASHAINWKNPSSYLITWNGSLTHNAFGVKGNGSTGYGNTGLVPRTALSASACGLGYYLTENKAPAASYDIGAADGGAVALGMYIFLGDGGGYECGGGSATLANDGLKQYLSGGTAGTANKLYRNGSLIASSTRIADISTRNLFLLARNNVGSPLFYSAARLGSACINTGLTDAEETANYISELAFQTALSRN